MKEVVVGDRTIRMEDFSGRKGVRVLRTLEHIAKATPAIQKEWQNYTREYESENTIDLDRAYARSELGPQPLFMESAVLGDDGKVLNDSDGRPLIRREPVLDENGQVRVGPDPLGHLSEQDWLASGNKLRRPRSPSVQEQVVAVFPLMIDLAENETARLLGLIAMGNSDVKRYGRDGSIDEKMAEIGDELLDAPFDQLAELLVVAGETVREQYMEKVVGRLGNRLGAVARLFGVDLQPTGTGKETSSTPASTTKPQSSTDSPPLTDGENEELSMEPVGAGSVA